MTTIHHLHLKRLGVTASIITLALVFLITSEKITAVFYGAIFWIENIINSQPLLGGLFFFVLSALSAILAFASTVPLLPSAILVWGMPLTFFLLLGGWIAGAMFTYLIGSRLARPALTFFVAEEKLSHYEHIISKEAKFWVILLFCLAVPSEIPGFILGAMRYDFAKFISAVLIAEAVYALGAVLIAQNILDKEIVSTGAVVILLFILIAAASATLIHLNRARKQ